MAILPFPGALTLAVGPVCIHWLAPHVVTQDWHILTSEDQAFASAIKAPLRRSEFERSRLLIRKLTGWTGSLAKTTTGAPRWPEGWTGSLTHKDGWVGVALKEQQAALSLGIDAELVDRLKPGFESKILGVEEIRRLGDWCGDDAGQRRQALAVIFSFKESLFKAIYPLGLTMFYFHDAEVTDFDPLIGQITAKISPKTSPLTPAGAVVRGHFVGWQGEGKHFVLTSVELHRVGN